MLCLPDAAAREAAVPTARLDNLGKGASDVAVRNIRLMPGLPETAARCVPDKVWRG